MLIVIPICSCTTCTTWCRLLEKTHSKIVCCCGSSNLLSHNKTDCFLSNDQKILITMIMFQKLSKNQKIRNKNEKIIKLRKKESSLGHLPARFHQDLVHRVLQVGMTNIVYVGNDYGDKPALHAHKIAAPL